MKEPIITYKDGHAYCEVIDSMGRIFSGSAHCADVDKDFENKLTGCYIAERRAEIAAARTYRDDLKIKLSALKQLLYSMKMSKHFNPKSYESKSLFRQIHLLENDLDIAKHQLAVLKVELYEYIQDKETLYQELRKRRKQKLDKKEK